MDVVPSPSLETKDFGKSFLEQIAGANQRQENRGVEMAGFNTLTWNRLP